MKEKVILAAIEEMKIHSIRFTMDDLTRRLHMSKTSLYKIVGSKEALIHGIIDYVMKNFEAVEQEIQSEEISSREKVSRFVDEYTKMFNLIERRDYDDLKHSYYEDWQRCEEFRRRKVEVLMALIREGMSTGEFRQVNPAVLQHCLILMSSMLSDTKFLVDNDLTYAQAINAMRDLMFHGILAQ